MEIVLQRYRAYKTASPASWDRYPCCDHLPPVLGVYETVGLDLGLKLYFCGNQSVSMGFDELVAIGPSVLFVSVLEVIVCSCWRDLEVVKWLFEHFAGCKAGTVVVDAAARHGHLHILEFLCNCTDDGRERDNQSRNKAISSDDKTVAESIPGNPGFEQAENNVDWSHDAISIAAAH